MAESVYKVVELVGTSSEFVGEGRRGGHRARLARVCETCGWRKFVEQDLVIENGKVEAYRTKLKVSFKYEGND